MSQVTGFAEVRIHPTAQVATTAEIGKGTQIWNWVQVREGAKIGAECILSRGVYVDAGVVIGARCKIQNNVSIYHGVELAEGVFCGPHCVFTNDRVPRAINPDGTSKTAQDWIVSRTFVDRGASIGANAVIRCGVRIGAWAIVGAGSVVTKDVPAHALVFGNPAQVHDYVCSCGRRLGKHSNDFTCSDCRQSLKN